MPANEMTVEALLRAHAPHAPEHLRERVFALAPNERRRLSLPPRRLALIALPAAVGVAVSVAVVHGIVGSGSPTPTVAAAGTAVAARDLASPPDVAELRARRRLDAAPSSRRASAQFPLLRSADLRASSTRQRRSS